MTAKKKAATRHETLTFSVEAGSLLLEVEANFEGNPDQIAAYGIVMGCAMIRHSLARIAKRTLELDDPVLMREMLHLGCLKPVGSQNLKQYEVARAQQPHRRKPDAKRKRKEGGR